MTNLTEWITIAVAVLAATAFFSYLVRIKATVLGHPARAIWRGLLLVWLCLAAAIVVLAGARATLGGPIIEYSASGGGFRLGADGSESVFVAGAALIVVAILLYVSLRTVRQRQEPVSSDQDNSRTPGGNSQEST